MRRRVILEESGEEDMAKFELQDTVTLTPTEKVKKLIYRNMVKKNL